VRRAVIDKNVRLQPGQTVGYDLEADGQRYHVTESGIAAIPKVPETPETLARNL
jgi:glucose-1-phosphate adenylyltransferase